LAQNNGRNMLENPQPAPITLDPLDDYVVIEPVDEETETRTGLIIPASAEAGCQSGIVTAVGTEAGGIEPGDKVLFPKGAGYDVRLAGTAVKVLRRSDLIARIHD
jgi:chaperonin GroES